MSLHVHEQATTSPRGHDLDEDSEGGWSDPSDSQTTLKKFNDADSDRHDDIRSESPGPVSSRTRWKTARATCNVLESDFDDDKEVDVCTDDVATSASAVGSTGDAAT